MTHIAIENNGRFKVLNLASKCAYGDFDTRAEAEEALREAGYADQLSRCGQ